MTDKTIDATNLHGIVRFNVTDDFVTVRIVPDDPTKRIWIYKISVDNPSTNTIRAERNHRVQS